MAVADDTAMIIKEIIIGIVRLCNLFIIIPPMINIFLDETKINMRHLPFYLRLNNNITQSVLSLLASHF
ncbi:hypothetical protein ACVLVH_000645 [Kluyvera sp. 1366]|jgi:hypothetical protein